MYSFGTELKQSTRCLLGAVASQGSYDGVLVACYPVHGTRDVSLCLSSFILAFAFIVFLSTILLKVCAAEQVADLFDVRAS
jgi:hypothetical protein